MEIAFVNVGSTSVVISVNATQGANDPLFRWVFLTVPLFGVPGLTLDPLAMTLQPLQSLPLTLSPDTLPTLKAYVTIRNSNPASILTPATLIIPAYTTVSRPLLVRHLNPAYPNISLTASSPGLLAQLSEGCSIPAAARCASLFTEQGCNFEGYAGGVGGGVPSAAWVAKMANMSTFAGASCSPYERCYRVSCCSSRSATRCAEAALSLG